MGLTTHNGTVRTDELFQPGYVWFLCSAWSLEDNTTGKTGWHVEYRPLADGYKRDCVITEAMRVAVAEHYAEQRAIKAREEAEVEARLDAEEAVEVPGDVKQLVAQYKSSDAAWEAEDEQAWATLQKWGY